MGSAPIGSPRVAFIMAFNSAMVGQAQRCVQTLRAHHTQPFDLCVVAIDLTPQELAWLAQEGARVVSDYRAIPRFPDAPYHAAAQTFRPYIPQIFPGYDVYLYADADIRFCDAAGADIYINMALRQPASIVVCQEIDCCYKFAEDPALA